jgi:hypothetical protein
MSRGLSAVALVMAFVAGCSSPPEPKPLQLDGNLLTVNNRTPSDWSSVEIWINQQYRVTVPTIAAGSRFTVALDAFVAGFGQRFDVKRQQLTDLRLAAKQEDGTPVEIRYEFEGKRLDEALKGFR